MTMSEGKSQLTPQALDYLDSILAGAVAEARIVLVDHEHMGEDGDGGCNRCTHPTCVGFIPGGGAVCKRPTCHHSFFSHRVF
ncbi:hypothetical protein OIE68_33650 [Nocardia vinacea]|uniref:Uncharacterized protein n=1 Tax=Nocardia vinacea TaxID=96468 RepID=A0ABZ1Z406_9NOCA|nr:hypothetical protein OIE68_33650 [Nocardia vinacea]